MDRQFIMSEISTGGFMGFETAVSLSRNERTKAWTVYFRCEDQEARGTLRDTARAAADFVEIFQSHGVPIWAFCQALASEDDEALVQLGREIDAALKQVRGNDAADADRP